MKTVEMLAKWEQIVPTGVRSAKLELGKQDFAELYLPDVKDR